jgi:hypothetical protein
MTLAQIAKGLHATQEDLQYAQGTTGLGLVLRNFIRQAFAAGFGIPQIMAYVDRSEIMVTHALRMVCVDEHGAGYGQPLAGIERILRAA